MDVYGKVAVMNCVCMALGSIPITAGCIVTKSAWPLLGFLLVPKWNCNGKDDDEEIKEDK